MHRHHYESEITTAPLKLKSPDELFRVDPVVRQMRTGAPTAGRTVVKAAVAVGVPAPRVDP